MSYVEDFKDDIPAAFDVFLHLALAEIAQVLWGQVGPHTASADVLEKDLNFEVLCVALVLAHGVRIYIGSLQDSQTTI